MATFSCQPGLCDSGQLPNPVGTLKVYETPVWVAPQIQVLLAIGNSGQLAETDQTVPEALEAGAWYTWGLFRKASEGGARPGEAQRACG